MRLPKTLSLDCPHCGANHDCPVEMGEFGPEANIPVIPCNDDCCTVKLCPSCPQAKCGACDPDLTFCAKHMTSVLDGTAKPLLLCRVCLAKWMAEEAKDAA